MLNPGKVEHLLNGHNFDGYKNAGTYFLHYQLEEVMF